MSGITLKVVEEAGEMLTAMLKMYHGKLDTAYLKSEGSLAVDLKAAFKPSDNGDMEVDVSINFVTDRIKNKFSRTICEEQKGLFDMKVSTKHEGFSIPSHWWPGMPDCRVSA